MRYKNSILKTIIFVTLMLSSLEVFYLDYLLTDINIILPYLIIIFISVWFIGSKTGFFFLVLNIILWVHSRTYPLSSYNLSIYIDAAIKIILMLVQYLIIIKLKNLYFEVRELALTDDLTGLHNRRGFYYLLEYQLSRIDRDNEFITLVYIDIDNFKKENDKKGHREGDRILKKLGVIIKETTRASDISGRLGGDEFCIFLYNTEQDKIRAIVERLVERFQNECDENSWSTTLSIGVVTTNKTFGIDELIVRGDELMYHVKEHGKQGILYSTL